MKKLLLLVLNLVLNNILSVIIGLIITTSVILEIFTKIKFWTTCFFPLLSWRWTGWVLFLIVIAFIIIYLVKNKLANRKLKEQTQIWKAPKYHASFDRQIEDRKYAGVIWKIFVGTDMDPSNRELARASVYAWPFPHAYCPNCDYELERKKNHWYCMPCEKKYIIPKLLRFNTWEKIRRNYNRLIVKWGYNNFGLAEDDYKPFRKILEDLKKNQKKD